MHFNIIASGSKGNATLVIYKKTTILIDMGVSFERLKTGLAEVNLTPEDINAAIFTHDHSDHISGCEILISYFALWFKWHNFFIFIARN